MALVKVNDGAMSTDGLFSRTNGFLFEIRPPQRRFKWGKRQIDELWSDILDAFRRNECEPYFLGTLLLVPNDDRRYFSVIDGQQRITTLSLLIAILRDRCGKFEALSDMSYDLHRLINRVDYVGKPVDLVVTLQDPDHQTYRKLVQEHKSTNSSITQEKAYQKNLLVKATNILSEHVDKHIQQNPEEKLRRFCTYLQGSTTFLPLEVSNESEGYLVFDTTNTRGMGLSSSERLKARLSTTAARKDSALSDDLIRTWDDAASKLENAGLSLDAMRDYLHAIWCSSRGYIPKNSLHQIASKLKETDKLRSFVGDIELYCSSYLAIVDPPGQSSLSEDLEDLKSLNVQSYGFLTMVHRHFPTRFEEAVNLVLSLQIRNITLGRYQANRYERDWPKWARQVHKGNPNQAFDEIRNEMVSDNEFQQSFETAMIRVSRTARHLLRRLDPTTYAESGLQPSYVDVEHVLPKSVATKLIGDMKLTKNVRQWIEYLGYEIPEEAENKKELGEEIEQILYLLGNQALLNTKKNRVAQDKPFTLKKPFYSTQSIKLTKRLETHEKWGKVQIVERQKEMAKQAPSKWPKSQQTQ